MNRNKTLFWLLWLGLLALVPITILPGINFQYILGNRVLLMNLILRILGLTAFTLLFWEIILGSNMEWFVNKLGGLIFRFHIFQGIAVYVIVILHPAFFVFYNYFLGKGIDPFYVFTQVCLLCGNQLEYYFTLGRVSFWLINIVVLAGIFRIANPFMQANWRKFHILNYLSFLLVIIHGLLVGTDFRRMPFFAFAVVASAIVLYIVVVRKIPRLVKNIRLWLG